MILHVYGGPSSPNVQDGWRDRVFFDRLLNERGFAVVRIDNRSATGRSKELVRSIHLDFLGKSERADVLEGVEWLRRQPWVDPERIGIWGWSGGGSLTLRMLTSSDVFAAGIAVAPVTDWTLYDTIYTEFAMKRPVDNPEGYARTATALQVIANCRQRLGDTAGAVVLAEQVLEHRRGGPVDALAGSQLQLANLHFLAKEAD